MTYETSYPYLTVAKKHGVPYTDVLALVEKIEQYYKTMIHVPPEHWHQWAVDTYDAWARETARQKRARQA